jgi:rubredoxin-NAD+ reductase
MKPIVIIGSGLAGHSLAREIRKLDQARPLHLLTADDGRFYSKPMLSNALHSKRSADDLATGTAAQVASQLGATIEAPVTVRTIDTAAHRIAYDGRTLDYDKLVLALGADPIRVPLQGDAADAPLSVNDLQGYARFRAALAHSKHVLIMGTGLIGCEFANDLCNAGYAVDMVDPAPLPLGRLMPPAAATALRNALAAQGVRWRLGTSVLSLQHDGSSLRATLADGTVISTDLVLSAIGLRPRAALAAASGLHTQRGIVTDRYLATSAPDVYALGDCAEVEGLVLPFVMPIMHAARALARSLCGTPTAVTYPAMPVVVKTPALATVIAPPPPNAAGVWEETVDGANVRALFRSPDRRLLGYALTGSAAADKNALTKELPPVLA